MSMPLQYAILGHISKDIVPEGFRWGGGVTYSGLTAAAIGAEVHALTSCQPDPAIEAFHPRMHWYIQPHAHTTMFDNQYDSLGNRQQLQPARANNIPISRLNELAITSDIIHLAPVTNEVDTTGLTSAMNDTWLVATPQGWMRRVDENHRVTHVPWQNTHDLLPYLHAISLSDEDVNNDTEIIRAYAAAGPTVLYTRGYNGAVLFHEGAEIEIPATPAHVVDPTGAGDVIAAAFFIRFRQTGDPVEAAIYGTAAAAIAIEHPGANHLPTHTEVMARLTTR